MTFAGLPRTPLPNSHPQLPHTPQSPRRSLRAPDHRPIRTISQPAGSGDFQSPLLLLKNRLPPITTRHDVVYCCASGFVILEEPNGSLHQTKEPFSLRKQRSLQSICGRHSIRNVRQQKACSFAALLPGARFFNTNAMRTDFQGRTRAKPQRLGRCLNPDNGSNRDDHSSFLQFSMRGSITSSRILESNRPRHPYFLARGGRRGEKKC